MGYSVGFCVTSVIINHDGHMVFNTSWTMHLPGKQSVGKRPDAGNRKMYLLDDLRLRYNHVASGGEGANQYVMMKDGDTVTAWFEFPAAQKNATAFTFYDTQQEASIGPLRFTAPIILTEITNLTFYPLTWEYLKEQWEVGETEAGGCVLTHTQLPGRELYEWEPGAVQGKFKNTNELGGITYEIYGWLEAEVGVREYLAVQGLENYADSSPPLFRTMIPYEDSLQCIFDVSEVLATLQTSLSEE